MSLVTLIDQAIAFVHAAPDRQMTRSELNEFGALAEDIYVETFQAGIQGALPQVSELNPQLEPLPEWPLPQVKYETKLNLPGDWWPTSDDEPNDSRVPMPEPHSLFPADGGDAEPAPYPQVFRVCATPRWFQDMAALRRLAETPPAQASEPLSEHLFREEKRASGALMTAAKCEELFGISNPVLSREGTKNPSMRRKNPDGGSGYVYLYDAVRDLSDRRSRDE